MTRDVVAFTDFVGMHAGGLFRTAYLVVGDHQLAQDELVLFQWLDDDRFVLSTAPGWFATERRDIVVCRVSTERCEITVRRKPGHWLALPGEGMPG